VAVIRSGGVGVGSLLTLHEDWMVVQRAGERLAGSVVTRGTGRCIEAGHATRLPSGRMKASSWGRIGWIAKSDSTFPSTTSGRDGYHDHADPAAPGRLRRRW
jgi:hypothetical protein